ncbi:RsmE family RNA methyltransferase [Leptospira harrisiae]|uniref:Ribosomal RNA small subunit methyltransferase E n=1 Tax=Leptospira harrisiae TaxID=2023189 RepID=A0A2N0ANK8_9LEPT|nr:RsmE family RNA methyltransferase [Leptospira harrisiae]PJZ85904.1 RNA methyltransferase [Leptospira harrisiae]PKA09466.1 RNA methyltransferase [Leptospira harrisiae]
MNWILIYQKELIHNHSVNLTGERHTHIRSILKKEKDETIQVVVPFSGNYLFKITSISESETRLEISNSIPDILKPLAIQTFFSLPRPQTGKKILHLSGAYGVTSVFFYATESKNKEYWTSPVYTKDSISYLETGLSQTGNNKLPNLHLSQSEPWKPFLKSWKGTVLILDREGEFFSNNAPEIQKSWDDLLFVFGPESGWKPGDILFFKECEFKLLSLGKINLRTEFAYSALLHQLFSIRN